MGATKVYIVKMLFQETLLDYWIKQKGAYFDKEKAEAERDFLNEQYRNLPDCPLPEGGEEYYDRLKWGLTSPDEDLLMGEWEATIATYEDFDNAFIEELEVI